MNDVRHGLMLSAALLCAGPLTPARAQQPTFTASVSGYTAIEGRPITDSDRVAIDIVQQGDANHAEASGEGGRLISYTLSDPNIFGFSSAYAVGYASSQPGVLRVYGGVRSVATDFMDTITDTSRASSYNVSSNILTGASFTDFITIGGVGMAPGTVVEVPVNFLAEMVSNYSLGYPQHSLHALSAYAAFTVPGLGPQNFSTESGYFPWDVTRVNDTSSLYRVRSDEFYVHLRVGDVFEIGASFGVFGQGDIRDLNRVINVGGFVDGRNTSAVWFGKLPDNVFPTSASGHDYTIDPTAAVVTAPVPEPETFALMLAGLLALGVTVRRRRQQSA